MCTKHEAVARRSTRGSRTVFSASNCKQTASNIVSCFSPNKISQWVLLFNEAIRKSMGSESTTIHMFWRAKIKLHKCMINFISGLACTKNYRPQPTWLTCEASTLFSTLSRPVFFSVSSPHFTLPWIIIIKADRNRGKGIEWWTFQFCIVHDVV